MAGTPTLQTAVKTIAVLEALSRQEERAVTLAHLAHALGWSKAATHQYLSSLVHAGWLEQDEERRYRLGSGAVLFARSVDEVDFLPPPIITGMEELVDILQEPISFAILHGDEAVIVERREPHRSLIHRNPERHLSLTSASGKALLAFDKRTQALWQPEYTPLAEEVVARGYAEVHNKAWMGDDVEAIAVPIMREEWCLGALSAIAPAGRMPMDTAAREMTRMRERIERAIAESTPLPPAA